MGKNTEKTEIPGHIWTFTAAVANLLTDALADKDEEATCYFANELQRAGAVFFSAIAPPAQQPPLEQVKEEQLDEDGLWLYAGVPVPTLFKPEKNLGNSGARSRPKSAPAAVARGEARPLSDFYKKIFEVMFGLNGDKPPGSVKELVRRAWSEEL